MQKLINQIQTLDSLGSAKTKQELERAFLKLIKKSELSKQEWLDALDAAIGQLTKYIQDSAHNPSLDHSHLLHLLESYRTLREKLDTYTSTKEFILDLEV